MHPHTLPFRICATIVRALIAFDRRIVKAYTGIETPLYKFWWSRRARATQQHINAAHPEWANCVRCA